MDEVYERIGGRYDSLKGYLKRFIQAEA